MKKKPFPFLRSSLLSLEWNHFLRRSASTEKEKKKTLGFSLEKVLENDDHVKMMARFESYLLIPQLSSQTETKRRKGRPRRRYSLSLLFAWRFFRTSEVSAAAATTFLGRDDDSLGKREKALLLLLRFAITGPTLATRLLLPPPLLLLLTPFGFSQSPKFRRLFYQAVTILPCSAALQLYGRRESVIPYLN